MKTRLPGVGEIERRRTIDRRRDWFESCAVIHGPKKKKKHTRKSACDCEKAQPFIIYKPATFEEPVSETRCRYRFALRCFRGRGCCCRTVKLQGGGKRGKAVIRDRHDFRCWSLRRNELECMDLVHWTEVLHRFRHVMQLSLLVLCWKSTLTVILPQIKKQKSLSNVGHRGTKAENLAWHSTG